MAISGIESGRRPRWELFWLNIVVGSGFLLVAAITKQAVWTAVPVGQLFGFFLSKGDLCGASAFSEIVLMRDGRKAFGLWIAIVVSMGGFAAAQAAGLVTLAPKPLLWANYTLGGLVFGAGTVLAGGCLYKAAGGGPVTLPSLTGIPFWVWALIFASGTVAVLFLRRKPVAATAASSGKNREEKPDGPWLASPWKPWQAGLAIGGLAVFGLLSSAASGRNYPIGITHGVLHIQELATDNNLIHVFGPPSGGAAISGAPSKTALPDGAKKVTWWLVLVVAGLFFGALAAASLSGRIRLAPKPPGQVVTAALGGFLVGVGAGLATGCVVGNILSGWALMSVGMFLFGVAIILANWVTTYFYLMGGILAEMPGMFRLIFKRR